MARGKSGPVVSLFAFQDIITSVSGILIVVVLLMALELVERPEADAAAPGAHTEATADALAAAEAERDTLKAVLADEGEAVREAAGTSAEELRRDLADQEAEIERVGEQFRDLEADAEALEEAAEALEVKQFDAAGRIAELEEARRRTAELQREIESARRDDRVVFTLPRGINRPGWLVVLSGEKLAAASIGVEARPTDFDGIAELLDWSEEHRGDYFLLLIRPSGIDAFNRVETAFELRGVTYGFDVIGETTDVLHAERGAAP